MKFLFPIVARVESVRYPERARKREEIILGRWRAACTRAALSSRVEGHVSRRVVKQWPFITHVNQPEERGRSTCDEICRGSVCRSDRPPFPSAAKSPLSLRNLYLAGITRATSSLSASVFITFFSCLFLSLFLFFNVARALLFPFSRRYRRADYGSCVAVLSLRVPTYVLLSSLSSSSIRLKRPMDLFPALSSPWPTFPIGDRASVYFKERSGIRPGPPRASSPARRFCIPADSMSHWSTQRRLIPLSRRTDITAGRGGYIKGSHDDDNGLFPAGLPFCSVFTRGLIVEESDRLRVFDFVRRSCHLGRAWKTRPVYYRRENRRPSLPFRRSVI